MAKSTRRKVATKPTSSKVAKVGDVQGLKELLGIQSSNLPNNSLEVGQSYMVRTVTHYTLGRLSSITETDLKFNEASWIPETGRWSEVLESGADKLGEVEPVPDPAGVIVSRGAIVDITPWNHALPRKQK